jgi:hypothetical protein
MWPIDTRVIFVDEVRTGDLVRLDSASEPGAVLVRRITELEASQDPKEAYRLTSGSRPNSVSLRPIEQP